MSFSVLHLAQKAFEEEGLFPTMSVPLKDFSLLTPSHCRRSLVIKIIEKEGADTKVGRGKKERKYPPGGET